MPKSNIDELFAAEIKEWTARKHRLLGRYVVPAASKMKFLGDRIFLVDAYAGANEYGGVVTGSTKILVDAAMRILKQGGVAKVLACEPDAARFGQLSENLAHHIRSGLLGVFNMSHSEALPALLEECGSDPALVFLDPQAPSELLLHRDLYPWGRRSKTDVLGVFMGTGASRVSSSALKQSGKRLSETAELILGGSWRDAKTLDGAFSVYAHELSKLKRFSGMYRLRKRDIQQYAYGIFGLSESPHGFHLLSDAVARDFGAIQNFDRAKEGPGLFEDEDENEAFNELLQMVSPVLKRDRSLSGQALAIKVYDMYNDLNSLFGRYTEPDFTKAAKSWRERETKSNG